MNTTTVHQTVGSADRSSGNEDVHYWEDLIAKQVSWTLRIATFVMALLLQVFKVMCIFGILVFTGMGQACLICCLFCVPISMYFWGFNGLKGLDDGLLGGARQQPLSFIVRRFICQDLIFGIGAVPLVLLAIHLLLDIDVLNLPALFLYTIGEGEIPSYAATLPAYAVTRTMRHHLPNWLNWFPSWLDIQEKFLFAKATELWGFVGIVLFAGCVFAVVARFFCRTFRKDKWFPND